MRSGLVGIMALQTLWTEESKEEPKHENRFAGEKLK
jgi:hypothetical protein